jgi:8-oxo-dGTP diphosphatase
VDARNAVSMEEYAYVVNVDGAVVRDDKYLLVERGADEEHASGSLGFPGGKVEQAPGGDATIETTVARELCEEVGIEIGAVEYVLSTTFETDDGTPCLNIVTLCEYQDGEAYRRDPNEVAAVHWLSSEEIRGHDSVPNYTKQYVEQVKDFRELK